jgi:hypothetical protein
VTKIHTKWPQKWLRNLYRSTAKTRRIFISGFGLQAPSRFKGSPCHHCCVVVPTKWATRGTTATCATIPIVFICTLFWICPCSFPHQRRRALDLAGALAIGPLPAGGSGYIGYWGMVVLDYIRRLVVARRGLVDYWF